MMAVDVALIVCLGSRAMDLDEKAFKVDVDILDL
jgi:hypothetical protein